MGTLVQEERCLYLTVSVVLRFLIVDFRVAFHLCFKARRSAKPSIWKLVLFTCKFWFISLALKKKRDATRKSPRLLFFCPNVFLTNFYMFFFLMSYDLFIVSMKFAQIAADVRGTSRDHPGGRLQKDSLIIIWLTEEPIGILVRWSVAYGKFTNSNLTDRN